MKAQKSLLFYFLVTTLVTATQILLLIGNVSASSPEQCKSAKENGVVPDIQTLNRSYALMPVTNAEEKSSGDMSFESYFNTLQGFYDYYAQCEPESLKTKEGRKLRLNHRLALRIQSIRNKLSECGQQEMQRLFDPLISSANEVVSACVDPLAESMDQLGANTLEDLAQKMESMKEASLQPNQGGSKGLYFEAYENSFKEILKSFFSHVAVHSGLKPPLTEDKFRKKAKSLFREKFCGKSWGDETDPCGPKDASYETYHMSVFNKSLDRFVESDLEDQQPVSIEEAVEKLNAMVGWDRRDFQNYLAGDPANRPYRIQKDSINESVDEVLEAVNEFECEKAEECKIEEDNQVAQAYDSYLAKLGEQFSDPVGKLLSTKAVAKQRGAIRTLDDFWQKDHGSGVEGLVSRVRSVVAKEWTHEPDARSAYHRPIWGPEVRAGREEYLDLLVSTFKTIEKDRSLARTRYTKGNNTVAVDQEEEWTFNNRDGRVGDLAKLLFLNPRAVGKALLKNPSQAEVLCPVLQQKEKEENADWYAELGLEAAGIALGGASLVASTTRGLRALRWAGKKVGKDWALKRATRQAIFRGAAAEGAVAAPYMADKSSSEFQRAAAIRGFWASSGDLDPNAASLKFAREQEEEALGSAKMAGLFAGLSLFGSVADYWDSLRAFDSMAERFLKSVPKAKRAEQWGHMRASLAALFYRLENIDSPEKMASFLEKAGVDPRTIDENRRFLLQSGENEHLLSALSEALGGEKKVGELLATFSVAAGDDALKASGGSDTKGLVDALLARILTKGDDEAKTLADQVIEAGETCRRQSS